MTEAIFGLVGVVVGALMTGGMDYFLEWRRERRERRRLTRLVALELATTAVNLRIIAADQVVRSERILTEIEPNVWRQYRDAIAAFLGDTEFEDVATSYLTLEILRGRLQVGKPLNPDDAKDARQLADFFDAGRKKLGTRSRFEGLDEATPPRSPQ
jgi:hypothetical protein